MVALLLDWLMDLPEVLDLSPDSCLFRYSLANNHWSSNGCYDLCVLNVNYKGILAVRDCPMVKLCSFSTTVSLTGMTSKSCMFLKEMKCLHDLIMSWVHGGKSHVVDLWEPKRDPDGSE